MKLNFRFEWYDESKTVMRYVAEQEWNWRDYHACVRASIFSMHQHPHKVDSLIDLRESTRATLPGGIIAHMSSFGRILTPSLSGNAVVLGMDAKDWQTLPRDADNTLETRDGRVYYATDEEAAQAILHSLRQHYQPE